LHSYRLALIPHREYPGPNVSYAVQFHDFDKAHALCSHIQNCSPESPALAIRSPAIRDKVTSLALLFVALPILLALYSYVGYPVILWLLSRRVNPMAAAAQAAVASVSVVIPAYNEERQIAGAIEAVLQQDFPRDHLQVLVVSDASTDETDSIVESYAVRGVELLRMPTRSGKTKAENSACARLRGNIIVNTDASVRLHRTAISELVRGMADPEVGVVSSRDVSLSEIDQHANITEAGYVNYEMWIRDLETLTGGIVGASGSCYAIRAELHKIPVRDDLSRDFASALTARLCGFRAVSARNAVCYVPRTTSLGREYRRKVRTISRGMDTLSNNRQLLNPFSYGSFAWKLFSHKVCRWLVPVAVLFGITGLIVLAPSHPSAQVFLLVGIALTTVAALGALWPRNRRSPRLISGITFAVAANIGVLNAIWRVFAGHNDHVWEPTRRSA
jgi:cellulose synthase/poly-beta-1,6-N-acetylglucosamine synthase-like glycosyltransferase